MIKHPNMHWNNIWRAFKYPNIPTDWKTMTYKVINDIIPTEEKKFRHNITTSPLCKICGQIDTLSHRLTKCSPDIWKWMEDKINRVTHSHNPNDSRRIILNLDIKIRRHLFAQTWIVMGYHHYMLTHTTPTLRNFQAVLRDERKRLQSKKKDKLLLIRRDIDVIDF